MRIFSVSRGSGKNFSGGPSDLRLYMLLTIFIRITFSGPTKDLESLPGAQTDAGVLQAFRSVCALPHSIWYRFRRRLWYLRNPSECFNQKAIFIKTPRLCKSYRSEVVDSNPMQQPILRTILWYMGDFPRNRALFLGLAVSMLVTGP